MNCENSHTEESNDSNSIQEDSASDEFELIESFMALSENAIIRKAAKEIKHNRTRWFKIEDKKAGTKPRYELVYMIGKHKKQTEHVQVRRMNDQVHPTYLHLKSAKKQPPSTCNYSARDIQWFLQYGFQSFINYQANRQDDVSGAVFQETKIPSINFKKTNYEAELQRKNKQIQSLQQHLKKAGGELPMDFLRQKKPNMFTQSNPSNSAKTLITTKSYEDLVKKITEQHRAKLFKRDQEIQFQTENASNFEKKYKEEQKRNEELEFQLTAAETKNIGTQDLKRQLKMLQREKDHAVNEFGRLQKEVESNNAVIDKNNEVIATLRNDANQRQKIENNVQTKCRNDTDDSKQQLIEQYERVNQEQHQTIEGLKSKYNAQAKQMEETANAKNELMREISQLKEKWSKTEREQNGDAADAVMPQDLIDHLTTKISEIEAERDELSKTLESQKTLMNQKDDALKEWEEKYERLQSSLSQKANAVDDNLKYQEMKYEYEHASAMAEKFQGEVNRLQEDLDSTKRVLNDKQTALQRIAQTKDDKDKEIHDLKQRIEIQRKQTEGLKRDHQQNVMENSKKLSDLETTLNEWKTKSSSLNTAYKTLYEKYNHSLATCASFKKEKEDLATKHNSLVRQNKELKRQKSDSEAKIDELMAKNINSTQLNESYVMSLKSMSDKMMNAAQRHAQKEHNTQRGMEKLMAKLRKQEEDSQRGMEKLRDELRKKKENRAETEDAIQNLTDSLDAANRIKSKFSKHIDTQKQEITLLKQQLGETSTNYTNMLVQKEENESAKHDAEDALKQFRQKYQTEIKQKDAIIAGYLPLERLKKELQRENIRITNLRQKERDEFEEVLKQNKGLKQANDEYKQQIVLLNVQNQSLQDVEKKMNEYKQGIEALKLTMNQLQDENQRLQDASKSESQRDNAKIVDDNGGYPVGNEDAAEDEIVIEKMSKEVLQKKYKILKGNNLTLQKRIMQLVSPSGDKSDFPVIEDIRGDFDTLRKQYCSDLFDELTNEIGEQYEELWGEQQIEDEDELYDREARRVLFDLLHITYHFVRVYKREKFEDIIDSVAIKFELTSNKAKETMSRSMAMVINPYFQNYYMIFSRHRYIRDDGKNNVNGELMECDMNKIIDQIYAFIHKVYAQYAFWNNKSIAKRFEVFIAKACELCWIMVLNTPQLYFYPRLFTLNDEIAKQQYDERVEYIYDQRLTPKDPLKGSADASDVPKDGDKETAPVVKKKKKKKKRKKNKGKGKDEEDVMDGIVKEHGFDVFKCKLFNDRYHDCLNEAEDMDEEDEEDDDDMDLTEDAIIDHNGMDIAYCGWPSLVRTPQLESEQHTQITKTFAYCHRQPKQFMDITLPKGN
eukprot:172538_1